jgi:ribosomal protein S20
MSSGIADKYAKVIEFYKCTKNMEDSRDYAFDFAKYAPNNYTTYLMKNYTLNELRDIARMCKDNAAIYGQIPWSIQNARCIRLSTCKETTVAGIHNYLYYKYVALHMRLSRPRLRMIPNSRFLQKIQKVLNRWVSIRARENVENARFWARTHNNIAKEAARKSADFKQRNQQYKTAIKNEITNLEYELEEYKYQYQQTIRDVNKIDSDINHNKEHIRSLHSDLLQNKMKLAELQILIKRYRKLISQNIKDFVSTYSPPVQEDIETPIPSSEIYSSPIIFDLTDMSDNIVVIPSPDISESVETEYIMSHLPVETLDLYFTTMHTHTMTQNSIQGILNHIDELSNIEIKLLEKYNDALISKKKKQEILNHIRVDIQIMENALIKKRKYNFSVYQIEPPNESYTNTCPICLEDVSTWATTNCKHNYCKGCIFKSLHSIHTNPLKPYQCALCRNKITSLTTFAADIKYQLEIKYLFTSCYVQL